MGYKQANYSRFFVQLRCRRHTGIRYLIGPAAAAASGTGAAPGRLPTSRTTIAAITTSVAAIHAIGIAVASAAVHAVGITVASPATAVASASTAAATEATLAILGHNLLDDQVVSVEVGGSLLDQLTSYLLLLEGDKCKILGLVIVGLVDRADDLGDRAELIEVGLNLLCGETCGGQTPYINFARLRLSLLAGDLLSLQDKNKRQVE